MAQCEIMTSEQNNKQGKGKMKTINQFYKALEKAGIEFEKSTRDIENSYSVPKPFTLGMSENNREYRCCSKAVPSVIVKGRNIALKKFVDRTILVNRNLGKLFESIKEL